MNIKLHALTFALLAATATGTAQAQDSATSTDGVAAQAQALGQVDTELANDAATRAQQEARKATDAAIQTTDAAATAAQANAATSPPAANVAVEHRSEVSTGLHTPSAVATTTQAGSQVTVKSAPSNSVVGEYKIDFASLDRNGDGSLNRSEASANATLTGEFRAVDSDRNGRLSKAELTGWM